MKRKRVRVNRMTEALVTAVVSEIEAYVRGERKTSLTWAVLAEFSGFSQVSMWKKPSIRDAFQRAKQQLRSDATPAITAPKSIDERIVALREQIEALREIVRAYDELWTRYEYNMHRLGLDSEELRRPLDATAREVVRNRSVRSVRPR